MDKTILQVPINQQIKKDAEKAASLQGFSSLQEAVRIFLNKLAQGNMQVSFEETVHLSKQAIERYNEVLGDIEKEKDVHQAADVKELLNKLHNAS